MESIVSIHAPTRGATDIGGVGHIRSEVSIHAPTRGATLNYCTNGRNEQFQFTRPRGARLHLVLCFVVVARVSIHAPTRGATKRDIPGGPASCFNSRAHAGRDALLADFPNQLVVSIHAPTRGATPVGGLLPLAAEFQFTRPRGARPSPPGSAPKATCFNSRAHAGRDPSRVKCRHFSQVSIHAPTRGATGLVDAQRIRQPVSIHAPTRGATRA